MKKYQNLKLVVFILLLTLIPTHFTFADEVLSSEDKLSTIPREEQSSKVTFGPVNENDKNDWSLFYKDGKYQVIFQLEEDASLEQTIVLSNVMKVLNSFGTEEIKNSITEEDKAILENMAANGVEKVTFKIDLNDGSVQRFITDIKTFESVISILPGDVINFEVYLKNASNHTFQYKEDSFTIATPKLEGTSSNNSTGFDGQKLPDEYQTHITKSIGLRSNGIKYLLTNAGILKNMDDNNTLMDIRSNKGLTFDEWLKVKEYLNNYFQTKGITYTNYRDALEAYLLDYYNNPENGYIKVEDKDKYSTIKDLAANNNNVSGNLYDTSNNYEFKIKVDDPSIASLILKELNIKVAYLHNEIKTLDRLKIIHDLRAGIYDVVVGINLLREGIDIPEVSLICILDADKQGFLRSSRSLIQTIGRAARNANGEVIMYADTMSEAMDYAIKETNRRREIQSAFNKEHNIIPKTIQKEIKDVITNEVKEKNKKTKITKKEKEKMLADLESEMRSAAANLDFERAMELRDIIFEMKSE